MQKPVLVVMAAGMGSRYGGLKQIDPVGPHGEIIIDYSLFDALHAGFSRVVFIISRRIEADFREVVGERVARHMDVDYVFQELDARLPAGFAVPEGRRKPWGTAHAILCCAEKVGGPFAVINADDYYGSHAFSLLYDRLCRSRDEDGRYDFSMVGFRLMNTLTEHGSVARGVCETDAKGRLVNVVERTRVEIRSGAPAFTEDGETWTPLPAVADVTCTIGPGGALTLSGDLEGTGTCASKIVDDRTLRLEVSMEDGGAFTGVCGVRGYSDGTSTPTLLLSNGDYILSFLPE